MINNSIDECRGTRGRPTNASRGKAEVKERIKENYAIKNASEFPQEIIEKVRGEVVGEEDETQLQLEMYRETAFAVRDKFIIDNPERIKKQISSWNIDLYIHIKKAIPKPDYSNIQLLDGLYSIYEDICASVGAVASIYGFSFFSGIPCATLMDWKNARWLTPEHTAIAQKWDKATTGTLFDKLYNGSNNTIGTIFGLKQRGYIEGQYVERETSKNVRNVDDIPTFEIEDKQQKS